MLRRNSQATRRRAGMGSRLQRGNPLLYATQLGLLCWFRADMGAQFGATLRASGSSPPAVTISGTATSQVGLYIRVNDTTGGTGLGQAKFDWSIDNGATFVQTGQTTAASFVLGTTGLTAAFPAGPYTNNNVYEIAQAQWNDQSGLGNHATQATAANQPLYKVAAFGAYAALDMSSTTAGMATPSVTLGAHTIIGAARTANGIGGWAFAFKAVANNPGAEIFCGINASISYVPAAGAASKSAKNVTATWLRDNARHTFAKTFDGTHAGHLAYVDGVLMSTTDVAANDPGAATQNGAIYIGNGETFGSSCRSPGYREFMAFSSYAPANIQRALHLGIAARAAGAL